MTRLDFIAECGRRLIHPDIALDNDAIRAALKQHDDKKVLELLDTEF